MSSAIPQVEFGEGRAYADLAPTLDPQLKVQLLVAKHNYSMYSKGKE